MAYSNSPLVDYTKLSPNHSGQRTHKIDRITIHCVVGQCTVERLAEIFYPVARQASSNYGVGYDGRIGMYVEEKNRSWCSSSNANDQRAITIEVASDTTHPYAVTDKAYNATIKLVADICKRNGIKKLLWFADKAKSLAYEPKTGEAVMTVHRWFANKSCPGDYLYNRHTDIANKVNALLGSSDPEPATPVAPSTSLKVGDVVKLASNATYYTGKTIPAWVKAKNWIIREIKGDRVVIDKSEDGKNAICSPVNIKFLTNVNAASSGQTPAEAFKPYLVKVTTDALNIRKGAGTNYTKTGCIKDKGVYTIVAESSGQGASKWGKLKSGAGWISLDYVKKI
ncbi:N-acetylmuramoyl-L-alanine amidase [bacterium]|nr:N-acetylmuramoyl-L-alanine amidase [bacterium]